MYGLIIFMIFMLTFAVAMFIIAGVSMSKIKAHCKHQEELNNQVKSNLNGFNATKTFLLNDNFTFGKDSLSKKMLAVDSNSEKILLIDYASNKMLVVNFDEILGYEVYENGSHITTGAGIGGFVGVFGAETNGNCKDLRLIIRVNKIENSQVVYDLVSDTAMNIGVVKSSKVYQECVRSMQEVVSFLEVIKNRNQKN